MVRDAGRALVQTGQIIRVLQAKSGRNGWKNRSFRLMLHSQGIAGRWVNEILCHAQRLPWKTLAFRIAGCLWPPMPSVTG